MKIWNEKTAFDFLCDDAWNVDDQLIEVISDAGKVDEFNSLAEETFPDGAGETELNDWLVDDWPILKALGLSYDKKEEEDTDEEI